MRVKLVDFPSDLPFVVEVSHVDVGCNEYDVSPITVCLHLPDGSHFEVVDLPVAVYSVFVDSLLVNGFGDLSGFNADFYPVGH